MVVWLLYLHIASYGSEMTPYLAFKNQDDCQDALAHAVATDGTDIPGECVAFAADTLDPNNRSHP